VVRRPRPGPSQEDKLEALHYQLIEAVADLATSDGWARMLAAAARFHDYSGGGAAVFELRECGRPKRVQRWAQPARCRCRTSSRPCWTNDDVLATGPAHDSLSDRSTRNVHWLRYVTELIHGDVPTRQVRSGVYATHGSDRPWPQSGSSELSVGEVVPGRLRGGPGR